jgi:hypothetical protein
MKTAQIQITVQGYDEETDSFEVGVPVYEPGDAEFEQIEGCRNDQIDVDDFNMPASLLAYLVGEFGEPSELVGRNFTITTRA